MLGGVSEDEESLLKKSLITFNGRRTRKGVFSLLLSPLLFLTVPPTFTFSS